MRTVPSSHAPRAGKRIEPGRLFVHGLVLACVLRCATGFSLEESTTAAPLGKLNVPAQVMASHCIKVVSPAYPSGAEQKPAAVVLRVVIWKSGDVAPLHIVSGPPSLEAEAMNALRQWKFKPYVRDGEPLDVTTEVKVQFDPQKQAGMVTHPK